MEDTYGHLMVEIIMPGVRLIRYTMPNEDSAALNGTFADGLWHSVYFEMSQTSVRTIVDGREYITNQTFTENVSSNSLILKLDSIWLLHYSTLLLDKLRKGILYRRRSTTKIQFPGVYEKD